MEKTKKLYNNGMITTDEAIQLVNNKLLEILEFKIELLQEEHKNNIKIDNELEELLKEKRTQKNRNLFIKERKQLLKEIEDTKEQHKQQLLKDIENYKKQGGC